MTAAWSLLPPQVLPVPTQVRSLCTHPQGNPHRLPIHQPGQGQEDQAHGHGCLGADPQSQQFLHQLCQLCGLLGGGPAQPQWPGEGGTEEGCPGVCMCWVGGGDRRIQVSQSALACCFQASINLGVFEQSTCLLIGNIGPFMFIVFLYY